MEPKLAMILFLRPGIESIAFNGFSIDTVTVFGVTSMVSLFVVVVESIVVIVESYEGLIFIA